MLLHHFNYWSSIMTIFKKVGLSLKMLFTVLILGGSFSSAFANCPCGITKTMNVACKACYDPLVETDRPTLPAVDDKQKAQMKHEHQATADSGDAADGGSNLTGNNKVAAEGIIQAHGG